MVGDGGWRPFFLGGVADFMVGGGGWPIVVGGIADFTVDNGGGGRSFSVASQISRLATVTRAAAVVRMGVMDSADGGAAPASGRAEPALVAEHGQSRGDGAWPVPR
jgi:hypothetical protein